MGLDEVAQENMRTRFVENPCRGIVLGKSPSGRGVQLSWIMGRSANSQNRVYVLRRDDWGEPVVSTEAADPSKVKDPSLIIYNAMRQFKGFHIVSNGAQTDTVRQTFDRKGIPCPVAFARAMERYSCEPDTPIFTPRITGYHSQDGELVISVLKADPLERERWVGSTDSQPFEQEKFPTLMQMFEYPSVAPGFGYCVTTYKHGDSKNLPSFEGEPFVVPIQDSLEGAMQQFWEQLDDRWRVALAGKSFDGKEDEIKIINRFEKVQGA